MIQIEGRDKVLQKNGPQPCTRLVGGVGRRRLSGSASGARPQVPVRVPPSFGKFPIGVGVRGFGLAWHRALRRKVLRAGLDTGSILLRPNISSAIGLARDERIANPTCVSIHAAAALSK